MFNKNSCAQDSSNNTVWSDRGRLINEGTLFAHLTLMKSNLAAISYTLLDPIRTSRGIFSFYKKCKIFQLESLLPFMILEFNDFIAIIGIILPV